MVSQTDLMLERLRRTGGVGSQIATKVIKAKEEAEVRRTTPSPEKKLAPPPPAEPEVYSVTHKAVGPEETIKEKYGDVGVTGRQPPPPQQYGVVPSYVLEQEQKDVGYRYQKGLADIKVLQAGIDPSAQYRFDEPVTGYFGPGQVVTGGRVKEYYTDIYSATAEEYSTFKSSIKETPVTSDKYIKRDGTYYQLTPELEYIIKFGEPKEVKELLNSLSRPDIFEEKINQAYRSLTPTEKEKYRSSFVPGYVSPVAPVEPTAFEKEKEAIRQRWSGEKGIFEQVLEFGRFWASGLTSPENILYHKTIGEVAFDPASLFGLPSVTTKKDKEAQKERILGDYTVSIMGLESARKKGEGFFGETFEVFKESYKPGGFGFTGTLVAVVPTAFKGLGLLKGTGGAILSKGIPIAVMGGMSTIAGVDIGYTYAMEEKGLLPEKSGLKKVFGYGTHLAVAIGIGSIVAKGPMEILPKPGILTREYPGVVSGQKAFDVFGRPITYGKEVFVLQPGRPTPYVSQPTLGTTTGAMIPYSPPAPYHPASPVVASFTQIVGNQRIIYTPSTGRFTTERITVPEMKPFDIKFKPPEHRPKSIDDIWYKPSTFDLAKQMGIKPVQKPLEYFLRGSFFISPKDVISLEKIVDTKGMKPFTPKTIKEGIARDIKPFEPSTDKEIKIWEQHQKDTFEKLRLWKPFTLQELIRPDPKQAKLFEKIMPTMKPLDTRFKPPVHKPMTIEDMYKKIREESRISFLKRGEVLKPSKQITLDSLFKFDAKVIPWVITTPQIKTPFKFPKPKTIIEKPSSFGKTILVEPMAAAKQVSTPGVAKEYSPYGEILRKGYRGIRFFEEEEYISDKWSDVFKTHTKQDVGQSLFVTPAKKYDISSVSKSQQDMLQLQTNLQKQLQLQKQEQLRLQKLDIGSKLLTTTVSRVDVRFKLAQQQLQRQAMRLRLVTIPIQITKQQPSQPPPSKPPTPGIPVIPVIPLFDIPGPSVHKEPGPGYNVFVKSRQYYQGKPKGSEKFRKLTTKSFSHSNARSLLGAALDHSIAQTGYVKPSGKPAQKLLKHLPSRWDQISYKFIRKKDRWVEDRAFAIDTRGESQELNVFQWHRRLPKKKKTTKKSRIVEYPTASVDMYSFERFNDRFNRMLRRQRI